MSLSPQLTTGPAQDDRDPDPAGPDGATADRSPEPGAEQTKGLFEGHVPMSLIMDLTPPEGPHSRDILDSEGAPDDAWWEPA
jgi:hypothetical protein